MVVDIADPRAQALLVEGRGAAKPDLLLRREEQLDPAVRAVLGHDPPRGLEHRGHGGLVVGAEDRATRVVDDAVLEHGLDRPCRRHRVEMGAEEERRAFGSRLDTAEEIADRRVDPAAGIVLVDRERERAEILEHLVGNRAFLPGRARHPRKLDKELGDLGQLHEADLKAPRACPTPTRAGFATRV